MRCAWPAVALGAMVEGTTGRVNHGSNKKKKNRTKRVWHNSPPQRTACAPRNQLVVSGVNVQERRPCRHGVRPRMLCPYRSQCKNCIETMPL